MIENCKFETWNYKYNQFCPCEILGIEKTGNNIFTRIHGYSWTEDRESGNKIVKEEFETTTYLEKIRNIGDKGLDILSIFSPGTYIQAKGYNVIVDSADFDDSGDIRVYYKYIEETEGRQKPERWDWINANGYQLKKVNSGYNFITISPEDKVGFKVFVPERLWKYRKSWYFEDPVDIRAQEYLENLCGFIRDTGETWMHYFRDKTSEKHLGVKVRPDGNLVCIDQSDPKNPKQMPDPKNPDQVFMTQEIEDFIEAVGSYYDVH